MSRVKRLRSVALVILFRALVSLHSWATFLVFTSRLPGDNGFYTRWGNGCALVRSGENPSSETVTLRTQKGMYGRPARLGEDLAPFFCPLYKLSLLPPLFFDPNAPLAQAMPSTAMGTVLGWLTVPSRWSATAISAGFGFLTR